MTKIKKKMELGSFWSEWSQFSPAKKLLTGPNTSIMHGLEQLDFFSHSFGSMGSAVKKCIILLGGLNVELERVQLFRTWAPPNLDSWVPLDSQVQ